MLVSIVEDRAAQGCKIEIPEDSLPIYIYNSKQVELFHVCHSDDVMLSVPASERFLRNFESYVFIDALCPQGFDKFGILEVVRRG